MARKRREDVREPSEPGAAPGERSEEAPGKETAARSGERSLGRPARERGEEAPTKEPSFEQLTLERVKAEMSDAWWNSVGFGIAVVISGALTASISLNVLGAAWSAEADLTLPRLAVLFSGAITILGLYMSWLTSKRYAEWKSRLGEADGSGPGGEASVDRVKAEMAEAWWNCHGYAVVAAMAGMLAMRATLPQVFSEGTFTIVAPGDFVWVVIAFFWALTLGAAYLVWWFDRDYRKWKARL